MIRLTRTVRPPASLTGEKRIENNLALIELRRAGEKPKKSVWDPAKKSLKEESHGKCAFCESPTSTVAYGDVEYFRPRSLCWWLAYCYDNFSYSCQVCNQTYKKATFGIARDDHRWRAPTVPDPADGPALRELARTMAPDPVERDAGGLPFDEFVREARKEKPFLVDPYIEDPEELYKWEADHTLKEVRIAARTNRVRAARAMTAAAEDLGLNREELCRCRWQIYETLNTLAHLAEHLAAGDATRTAVAEQIRGMMSPDKGYAGMVRYFVHVEWELDI